MSADCVETGDGDRQTVTTETPATGQVLYYLIRAVNSCSAATAGIAGTVGTDSAGAARPARTCP